MSKKSGLKISKEVKFCSNCGNLLRDSFQNGIYGQFCKNCNPEIFPSRLNTNSNHRSDFNHDYSKSDAIYDDWDPPAASTVYCRMYGMEYSTFKYSIHSGATPSGFDQIKERLDSKLFCCLNCSNYVAIKGNKGDCTRKNICTFADSICKRFDPDTNQHLFRKYSL